MNKETKNWLAMVKYDLKTADQMFETGRYVYVIFMCHLAVEKSLKAIISSELNQIPPKTHDLIYLLTLTKIDQLPTDLLDFMGVINNTAIVTRYPEDLSRLVKSYPKIVTQKYLEKTKELIKWILKDPK